MTNRLRPFWDFGDLDASEARLRAQLERETTDAGRAEVLTQLARVEGLRGRFAEGERLVAEAEELGGAEAWVHIERGRLLRSSGREGAALRLFEAAFELATEQGDGFLAGDAAHMAALVGDAETWTERGVALAESGDPGARYWLAPLLNNIGWARYASGDAAGALAAFERALDVRTTDETRPHEREIARYAVGKTLRSLGRLDEATAHLEQAVAWARASGTETPYFHEELAECYAAAGRADDARSEAVRALELLREDDVDAERLQRLRTLGT